MTGAESIQIKSRNGIRCPKAITSKLPCRELSRGFFANNFLAHEERALGYEIRMHFIAQKVKFVCVLLTVILSGSLVGGLVFVDDEPKTVPAGEVCERAPLTPNNHVRRRVSFRNSAHVHLSVST